MLQSEDFLHIVPLHFQKLFALIIVKLKKLIFSFFNLLLQVHIVISCGHQSYSHISWEDDVHDVDLLDDDSIALELAGQLIFDHVCNLGLHISNIHNSLLSDEVPDSFFAFLLEELFQSVRTEIVKELSEVVLFLLLVALLVPDVEVDTDVDRHHNVVFGRDVMDRALESDCVFSDHGGHSPCITQGAEAAMKPWLHQALIYSKSLADGVNAVRDVQARDAAS